MIKELYEIPLEMKKRKLIGWKYVYKINKLLINIFYPVLYRNKKNCGIDQHSDYIVSLTTFPKRINTVWITIETIMQQTIKPRKIILWLAEEEFPTHILPDKLKKMEGRGLEIAFCNDLKSHKKYYYTMKNEKNSTIVTVDDDIFYPENTMSKLLEISKHYPNTVVCHWSHIATFDTTGEINRRTVWDVKASMIPSHKMIAIGCCGVLYPPNCLDPEVFIIDNINQYSYYTDDLWLKCMELKKGTKVVNCNKEQLIFFNILNTQSSGLWNMNIGINGGSNRDWELLMTAYPEAKERMMTEYESKNI